MADKFLIAPFDSGLILDKKPFAIPDQSFTELKNAYAWRGRIVKRFGSELSGHGADNNIDQGLYSKGAIDLSSYAAASIGYGIGVTDGTGSFTGTFPNFLGVPTSTYYTATGFKVGQYFQVGTYTYTIPSLSTSVTLTASGGAGSAVLNMVTGVLTLTNLTDGGSPAKPLAGLTITFYPYVGYPYYGKTDGAGADAGRVPGNKFKVGQQFSIGDAVFTVVIAAGGNQNMLSTITLPVGDYATFDTNTGIYYFQITAYPNTAIFYYPSDPIMGFSQYEVVPISDEPAFAYDTQFAYQFNGSRWLYSGPGPASYFHGDDSQFFWSCNYQGVAPGDTIMIISNFNYTVPTPVATDDPMWYYDGKQWNIFAPISIPGTSGTQKTIVQAKIIMPYKNHLHLMDTIEQVGTTNTRYQSRDRFSWIGSPIGGDAKSGYPFYEYGQLGYSGGGWVDAGTQETINSAEYLKDRLDVGFERSTYELTYTGNETEPFEWNKLNTELGCESPFATVPFDKSIFSIGVNGITACNGMNVERIDNDIPNYIFGVNENSAGTFRIQGVRDYKTEMVYWTLPVQDKTKWSYFPNTVLVYNYKNNSWATNDDCITAWGYFEQASDKTWADMTKPWREYNFSWNSYVTMAKERLILAGNQQGYIVTINPIMTSNANSMSITNFVYDPVLLTSTITIINHTLMPDDFINLYDLTGVTLNPLDTGIHKVATVIDKDTITLNDVLVTAGGQSQTPYLGGGTCSRVSRVSMKTKQWNFYLKEGRNFLVNKIDFLVARSSGQLKIEQMPNSTTINLGIDAQNTGTSLGNYPFSISLGELNGVYMEPFQDRIWRTIFPQADANFIQLRIYLDDWMMKNPADAFSTIEINAIMLTCKPTGQILEGFTSGY
jgi:hypothetical protein